jgi:hypothetical protein
MIKQTPKEKRVISKKDIQCAITNNRLSGLHVSDAMVKELIKILEENPEKSGKEIMALVLKNDGLA